MKLLGVQLSPFTRKVRIVLAEKKIDYDFVIASPQAEGSPVPAYNPLGKVPVLVLEDESAVYDSRVIVEFLDNVSPFGRLIPPGNRERVEVRRWEALADGVLDAAVLARYESQRSKKERSAAWIERQMGKIRAGVDAMERDLGDKSFCTGNTYTLADIAAGVCLGYLDFRFPQLGWRDSHPNLVRLDAKLAERSSFIDTVPRDS
jgi:glutathione S-transferase